MRSLVAGKQIWLNYNHLYYFKVIADEGSISKAAEKLRIGQPTLSAQLKQFEDALGMIFFHRSHRKLQLNESGMLLKQYADEIFRMGSEMLEVIHDHLPTRRLHVNIGALDSIPKHMIQELVKSAVGTGECFLTILEGSSDELTSALLSHKIDLLLSNFVPSVGNHTGLSSRRIARSPIVVCGSARFKSLRKGFPHSLKGAPFVVPTVHSKLRHDLENFFKLEGITVDFVAETQDTAVQKLLGIEGIGLVPLPFAAVKDHLARKDLYRIGDLKDISEDVFLISASRKIENPMAKQLMRSFKI